MKDLFQLVVLQILIAFLQVLPISCCARLCETLAWLASDVIGFRKKVIHDNLRGVYPNISAHQLQAITRRMWYHLLLMTCEVIQAPRKIHDTNWRKHFNIRDKALITEWLIDYRPLVVVSGHFGNFEMGGFAIGLLGMPSYTVARPLDNVRLDQFLNNFRSRNGQFILPKDGSAVDVQEVLNSGGKLAILGDQHAGTKGCWVDFLGRPAACHKAVALFTLSANAPMIISYCRQTHQPLHFEIGCSGVADPMNLPPELRSVTALTQWYNDRIGEVILNCPEQFWWIHRRWKEKPSRKTSKTSAAA
jgi:Kdo2-lipid IVA lauroyltransferase/acyltransferase